MGEPWSDHRLRYPTLAEPPGSCPLQIVLVRSNRRPLAMVKLTFCLRRRPDLTVAEFSRYWGEVHAPLVEARGSILGIRRYVQVRTVDASSLHKALQHRNGGAPEPFDGIAELWFDDMDAFVAARHPEAQTAAIELLEDERRFIDLPNSPMWLGEERVILG